ncbi:MAG: hypothetical protein D6715_13545, partial [Calditrichaeota bacterium]
MLNKLPLLLLLVWVLSGTAAQQDRHPAAEIEKLYRALQFEQVVERGRALLQSERNLTLDQLKQIHQFMALSFYTLGQVDSARSHFLSLLSLDPQFELDPVTVSPKIIAFFEELKARWAARVTAQPTDAPFVRYVVVRDPRVDALWRSAIFPGWGQRFKGQKHRGLLFSSAFLVTGLATGVSWVLEKQAHDDYLASTDPQAIESNYRDYNRWYKRRRTLGLA